MGKFLTILEQTRVDEARKVGEHENGNRKATIHHDAEYGEYHVKFHLDGKHQKKADYHTDDKEDAHGTAKHWVNQKNEATLTELADTKGDFGGKDGKRDYHLRKAAEHEGVAASHRAKSTGLGDQHAMAAHKHDWASSDHKFAAHLHATEHEVRHEASANADAQSELAHKASKHAGH